MSIDTEEEVVTWPWPDSLDALIAAPESHKLLMENDRVRVLETLIHRGERTPVHTHRWPCTLYILSWSDFVRYDERGEVLIDSRKIEALSMPAPALWSDALPPHSLENVGGADLRVISVELKD